MVGDPGVHYQGPLTSPILTVQALVVTNIFQGPNLNVSKFTVVKLIL